MTFINKVFSGIEKTELTVLGWFTAVFGVVMIRAFLENFVGLRPEASMTSNSQTLVHFFLFWVATMLAFTLVVHYFTRRDIVLVMKMSLFGMSAIFIAPALEFLVTGGEGAQMSYLIVGSGAEIWSNFITFWQTSPAPGVTFGMRVEILFILVGLFMYARYTGADYLRSFLTILGVYIVVFLSLVIPSIILFNGSYGSVILMKQSLFGHNFLHPDFQMNSVVSDFELYFDGVLSQVLYLAFIVLGLITAFRWNAKKLIAIIKNSRPERVAHYFFALLFGILLAYHEGVASSTFGHWLDFTTVIILFLSFYFAWMFSVGENDLVDLKSDSMTNSKRPLVVGAVSVTDVKSANIIFLVLSLLGAYLVGPEALFMVMVFIGVYHIYSCPPLHFKRFAIANSFLISLVTLSTVVAGFFTFNKDAEMSSFPSLWVIMIVVLFTLFLNIKDIKDIEGDKKFGIFTIPVLFGEKTGKRLIWLMMTVGLVIFPLVLDEASFWLPSIIASIASWFIIHHKPYNERYFFYLYLPYFLYFLYVYFFL